MSTSGSSREHGRTVLVVEDDPTLCRTVMEILFEAGYTVFQTTSASVGLRLARRYRPTVIVLDLLLGEESGLDLLADLRQASARDETRVVVISGSWELARGVRAQAADAVLLKPFRMEDLLSAVQKLAGSPAPASPEPRAQKPSRAAVPRPL